MIKSKIQADIEIFKNKKLIHKKYEELEKRKVVSDLDLLSSFNQFFDIKQNGQSDLLTILIFIFFHPSQATQESSSVAT